jgi:hypothetical protein
MERKTMKVMTAINAGKRPGTDSGCANVIAEETGATSVFVARPDFIFCLDFASITNVSSFVLYIVKD